MIRLIRILVVLAFTLPAVGCEQPTTAPTPQSEPQPQSLPTVEITLGARTYTVEIANTEDQRQMGLMHRHSMPENRGMIFAFPDERPLGFWMKNTHIPLDIIYLNSDGIIVSTHRMLPHDVRSIPSAAPAKYAIELNAGEVAKTGLRRGDRVEIPEPAREGE